MRIRNTVAFTAAMVLLAIFLGAPANAGEPGEWNFEIYGGWYFAGDYEDIAELGGGLPEDVEDLGIEPGDDLTWGLRAGRRQSETWGWQATLGLFDVDEAAETIEQSPVAHQLSLELYNLEFSFIRYVGDGDFYFYGGPGVGLVTVDLHHQDGLVDVKVNEQNEAFSLHAGLGYNFDIGERAYIRLDSRLRYIDADYYSGETDFEATIAIGWDFGG